MSGFMLVIWDEVPTEQSWKGVRCVPKEQRSVLPKPKRKPVFKSQCHHLPVTSGILLNASGLVFSSGKWR